LYKVKLVNVIVSPSLSAADILPTVAPFALFSFIAESDWLLRVGFKLSVTLTVIGNATIESESCPFSKCSSDADILKLYVVCSS